MSGLRAALRIAVRDALRAKGRTALLATMVLVPVALATAASVGIRSNQLEPVDEVAVALGAAEEVQAQARWTGTIVPLAQDVLGDSFTSNSTQALPYGQAADAARTEASVARLFSVSGNRVVPVDRRTYQRVVVGDRTLAVDVVETDVAALGDGSPFTRVEGRVPASATEVAVSSALARLTGVKVGDRVRYAADAGPRREYTVVGVVTGSRLGTVAEVIGRRDALFGTADVPAAPGRERSWFVIGPHPVSWEEVRAANVTGVVVLSRAVVASPPPGQDMRAPAPGPSTDTVLTVGVVVALLLLQIALLVGPAVAVGARRNERMLALLAATGGDRRHLALVVVAGTGVVALVAGLVGVLLGVSAGALAVTVLRERLGWVTPRVDVASGDLAGFVVGAVLVALAAAALPARRVARMDVVATLAGRRPRAVPRLRVPWIGLTVVACGAVMGWVFAGEGAQGMTVLGLGVLEVGLVLTAPFAVAVAARVAARAPLAVRFAWRDAARQGARTVPAVAATLAAVAAATCLVVYAQADDQARRSSFRQQAPLGATLVWLGNGIGAGSSSITPQRATDLARSTLPVTGVGLLYAPAGDPFPPSVSADLVRQCSGLPATGMSCAGSGITAIFVDPADAASVLPQPDAVQAALANGKAVVYDAGLLQADGTVALHVYLGSDPAGRSAKVPAVLAPGPERLSSVVLARDQATRLGVRIEPDRLVVRTSRPPTQHELDRLGAAIAAVGPPGQPQVQEPYSSSTFPLYVLGLLLASLLVLVGTFSAVGLAAADARPDLATLSAVGADPRMRRGVAAAQAAAITVPGAVFGVLGGALGGWILIRLNSVASYYAGADWRYDLPAAPTAALLIGLPLLTALVGWLAVRSRLATPGRVLR